MLSVNHTAVKKAIVLSLYFSLACVSLSLTACSKTGNWVTGATLSTSTQNGDQYVQLSTMLNTGGIGLIPLTLPVLNPHNPTEVIGTITIKSGLGSGASELDLAVNLSAVLALPDFGNAVLPNGSSIPVAGVNAANWISLPVAGSSSRLYLNLDFANKKVVMGAAVGIDQLSIGIPASLLLPFSSKGISGAAGIYTGVSQGQSGFAIFVDASSLISSQLTATFMAKKSSDTKIQQKLYELNMSKSVLRAR